MAKGSSLVKYGDFSEEDAAEEAQELDKSGGSKVVLKLEPGKKVLRFIPPPPGKKWKRVVYVHYIDVPGVGRVSFNCPRHESKKYCIACEREQRLRATGNERDEKKAMSIMAKRQCFANVIDRADEAFGPHVLRFGKMIEKQLIELRQDEDMGGNFIDPVKGIDVAIITKGSKMSTEYKVVAANKAKLLPLADDVTQMNAWIEGQHNLEKYAKILSADDIEKLLKGEKIERRDSSDDEEEDERPARSSKRDSDDEETDEEDAAPRRPAASKPAKKPKRTVDEEIEDIVIVDDDDD